MGRSKQALDDLNKAASYSNAVGRPDSILWALAWTELAVGQVSRGIQQIKNAITVVPSTDRGALTKMAAMLARLYALAGDLDGAKAAASESEAYHREMLSCRQQCLPGWVADGSANVTSAWAALATAKGHYREAEKLYRQAIATRDQLPATSEGWAQDQEIASLARVLSAQGRHVEAEIEARKGLLRALQRGGKYSARGASALRTLTEVVLEQVRPGDAERLARTTLDIFETVGSSQDSIELNRAREQLARALVAQRRWSDALEQFERIRLGMTTDPEGYRKYFAANVDWAVALLKSGQIDPALSIIRTYIEWQPQLPIAQG